MPLTTEFLRKDHVDQYDKSDWGRSLFNRKDSIVHSISSRILIFLVWSTVIVLIDTLWLKPSDVSLRINSTAHIIVGTFLSLLLVFRTNASYDRWWEGRRQWGNINNECRNFARTASVFLKDDPALLTRILHWTMALPWAIMNNLHDTKGLGAAKDLLPQDEVDEVMRSNHVPLAVSRMMSQLLLEANRKGLISDYVQMAIDQNVQLLVDAFGACERIHKTPLPVAYVLHLRRALVLYIYTLPFALLSAFRWETIPAMFLIGGILFGIEEIGVEIEDPFGKDPNDLPLGLYCHGIQKVVQDILDQRAPKDLRNDESAKTAARSASTSN